MSKRQRITQATADAAARIRRESDAKAAKESLERLWALRDAIQMLDELRLDYRRRFAIEEQEWLRPRIERLDEIRKIAGLR